MKSNNTKKSPKTVTDWSFDQLLGTPGPLFSLNASTALTHLSVWACKDVICIMLTQCSYCTCETLPFFLLRKAALAQAAPKSRHIPFPGIVEKQSRDKWITLFVSFFTPSLKRAQCFLSSPKWAKTTVLRSFPVESSGSSIQWWKVWGVQWSGGGGGVRRDTGQTVWSTTWESRCCPAEWRGN